MRKIWIELRSSLWFVPSLLVLSAIVLGFGLVEVDVAFAVQLKEWGWVPFIKAGAAGARGMLESIASSMITIAGLAFSITIVTLSLASTQYTPRILRNFMRDRANQTVLGVFVGIYVYCLIVLRTIRDGNDGAGGFVPLVAVSFGVVLALVGIGYLIFFIHHIASSIQASSILDSITRETFKTIERLFPQQIDEPEGHSDQTVAASENDAWYPVPARSTGYIQSVDGDNLYELAEKENIVLRLDHDVGNFVTEGESTVSCSRLLDKDIAAQVGRFLVIGSFRTVDQDVSFGIRQIVDIALKALSPGINGTTTAVTCLDYLAAILTRLAERPMASPYRKGNKKLRVIAPVPKFADFVAKSLDEIRLCASNNVTIFLSMLALLSRVARASKETERQAVVLRHASLVISLADCSIPAAYDRQRINDAIKAVRQHLGDDEKLSLLSVKE